MTGVDDMSQDDMGPEDRDFLAAEYALGLAEGADRARALALLASDEDFRARVAHWSGRLAPLLDETAPSAPPAGLWPKIEAEIGPRPAAAAAEEAPASNVYALRRRVTMWRTYSAAATALAASLALFLVTRPAPPAPVAPVATSPLVATMAAADSPAKLVATYDPATATLIVAAAAGVHAVPGKGHELWIIPKGGKPRPMGMIVAATPNRMHLEQPMVAQMKAGTTLALSVEPAGGSPTGLPTGPVVAAGALVSA
jgi:anti-sigma-K factor RskA